MIYKRIYKINIPSGHSIFLWGARKVGKTTYLKEKYFKSKFYNFLDSQQVLRYSKEPYLLREEIRALPGNIKKLPIIIDEVQKVPEILNEVHLLIEEEGLSFILCGSSARNLKKSGVNLLGGRAWPEYFYPLVFPEITDFDLLKVLNRGTIPSHYSSAHYKKLLAGYISVYLTEEIKNEGLVRNLPGFARFLDAISFTTCELVNYSNIARDCGVSAKTVKEYFQILVDTLLCYQIEPFTHNPKRNLISSAPKFYLFDVGVLNHLCREQIQSLTHARTGKYFENYIAQELVAYNTIRERSKKIRFWRTRNGTEVDFIIGDAEVAIEVKISNRVRKKDLSGLKLFHEDFKDCKLIVVSTEPNKRKVLENGKEIIIYPYVEFLKDLWNQSIF
tara:strand:- start:400 stop:1566 length:1167 start_codon:yes stop_codon:yes gene_type:complete